MRGKEEECDSNISSERITPAYAGKRVQDSTICTDFKDHPRLCGEKAF